MAPPRLPHKPGESADAYVKRLTAAEGVPEPIVVYQEHAFWKGAADIIKRYQTILGLMTIVAGTAITTTKANKIIDRVAAADLKLAKLDEVVTKEELREQLKKAIDEKITELSLRCVDLSSRTVLSSLMSERFVMRAPNYPTRGKPYDARIVDLKTPRE